MRTKHGKNDSFPEVLPVFPLDGVLLLPGGDLPLNIFEPHYLNMVDDVLRTGHRMIGMIQPRRSGGQEPNGQDALSPPLYDIGCAGRITSFTETPDGRYRISLRGLSRFRIAQEKNPADGGYRRVSPAWQDFSCDAASQTCLQLDRTYLLPLLETYFELTALSCSWEAIHQAEDAWLITCLSMICPLDPCEKQALLEAETCQARADLFLTILEMSVKGVHECCYARNGDEDDSGTPACCRH